MQKLTTPGGHEVDYLISELSTTADFLNLSQRARIGEIFRRADSLAVNSKSSIQSLDIMAEIDATVATLILLRDNIQGVSQEKGLIKQDYEGLKLISTTITALLKNATLLKELDRVAALQKGLVKYADRLPEGERAGFLSQIKEFVELDITVEM